MIGRKSFTILYTLSCNRCRVNTTTLTNSKANAFILLDTKYAKKILEFLNTLIEVLERPVLVKGYNRQIGNPITSILQTYLQVNRRRQYNIPFLITDLGHYNVILECK